MREVIYERERDRRYERRNERETREGKKEIHMTCRYRTSAQPKKWPYLQVMEMRHMRRERRKMREMRDDERDARDARGMMRAMRVMREEGEQGEIGERQRARTEGGVGDLRNERDPANGMCEKRRVNG